MCLSFVFLCVVSIRFIYEKESFINIAGLFLLNASDLHPPLQIQTFYPPLYIFVVMNYPCLCCKFVGDLTHSFVTFCSLFHVE